MTNKKMEQRLAAAVEKTAPNDANGVLSRCEERKGTVIPMTTKKTTKRKWTSLIIWKDHLSVLQKKVHRMKEILFHVMWKFASGF